MNNLRDDELIKQVGQRIKLLREERSMTMEALADKCDIEKQHIYRLEKGEQNYTISTLKVVAKGLGLSLSEFLKGL